MNQTNSQPIEYNLKVVKQFTIMTIVWGIVGMSVGVLIAAQLVWPALNFDTPWLTYGRLRPLHTNAVVFAFGTSALFATAYYVVQKTCHAVIFRQISSLHLLGVAISYCRCCYQLAHGLHHNERIRGA